MYSQKTSQDLTRFTSSLGSADGLVQLDLLDGLTTERCGPDPHHASHLVSPEVSEVMQTIGTCGPTFIDSSSLAGPVSSSANRSPLPLVEVTRGKPCKTCGEHKSYANFYANKKGQTRASCIECLKAQERARKAGTKAHRSDSFKKWSKRNRCSVLIGAAKWRAKQNNLAFDLDEWKAQLEARFAKGVCEMTGLPLNMDGGRTWDSPSLDRIYPEDGYTISNVRIVLFALNVMMNTWGVDPVLKIVASLKPKDAFQERLQESLSKRLSEIGWTACSMIWKDSVTPAGRPLPRLVPSARSTKDYVFTLLPTPSGTSNHGKNHVAGRLDEWGGSSNPFRGIPIGKVHSPGFELWMMGYPDAWLEQMPRETPSSRKSLPK